MSADARAVQHALHEVWLAIHARRFEDRSATVDSFYAGTIAAETEIRRYCADHGLNRPDVCTHAAQPTPEPQPEDVTP